MYDKYIGFNPLCRKDCVCVVSDSTQSAPLDKRITFRVSEDDVSKIDHYAEREGLTRSEFMYAAVEYYMKWINSDYDLPRAEIQRLNQLVDGFNSLTKAVENNTNVTLSGFDGMMNIYRGDNYLDQKESGDLDE